MEQYIIDSGTDFVKLNISNSKNDRVAIETKFAKSLNVAELKKKLEVITGGNANTMEIELYNGNNLICKINDNATIIGSLPIVSGMRLHVIDSFVLIEPEAVEKFELSEDQYEKKTDTVRNFLKQNRLGKYNEDELREKEKRQKEQEKLERDRIESCKIGLRCQVQVKGNPTRIGTIRYNGSIEGKKGTFIGVEYDEPLGKNNGSINGKRYFQCKENYGGFVAPISVEVGDFPPDDINLDDEI
ncbi:tubulin-folding cofactor B-like [Teleopsis dalmanni]|uniref:tubulin-folding cofactor B n=1 Tax=Teleopsis dalmanni TaxID=139649 RepID=UPI0018CEB6DE|nr:tubulin-folding cofactor B [Teleopsis dalmanni]XP_037954343.1 tubulin-folding cofactor B-like [Teleopsis dalmanni]